MWLQGMLYFGIVIFTGLVAFTPLLEESVAIVEGVPTDTFGPLYDVYLIYTLVTFLVVIMLVIWKLRKIEGLDKKKFSIVALGFITFFFLGMMTNVILPIYGIFILQAESVSFLLFFFVSVLIAVYKQRFFNLTYITLQLLRSVIVFILFGGFSALYYTLIHYLFLETDVLIIVAIAVTLAFITYRWIDKKFPDLYLPEFLHLRNALARFNHEIFSTKTHDQIDDKIQETFEEKLNIKNARLYILETEEIGDDFTKALAKAKDVVVLEELLLETNTTRDTTVLIENMKELGAALCIPLRKEGRMIGFLKLGERQRNKSFSREEIDEIYKVIPSLEVALMNILITNSLREENDIMKEIIHARTKTLKKNNKKLEKMIEQQNNFISLTAHEFRTPLTVAILGLEQISFVHKGKVSSELEEDIKTSHEQLNKLTELINRLLEIRRIDDNKIPVVFEKINIIKFIRDNVKGMNLLAQKDDVEILFKGPRIKTKIIETDAVKLKEILDNLLQNAIKFSEKNQQVEVTAKISRKNKKVIIKVQDHGRGIAKKDQKIIFEKFQQGSQYNQGVGIGLYLCKKYVELLEGNITVTSKKGSGATFTVEIPFTPNIDKN